MKSSKNIGTVRTGLPAAWATLFTWLIAKFGLSLEEKDYAVLMIAVPVVIPIFYRLFREVEQRWPVLGHIVFGKTSAPTYDTDK
jgi:hypothetical protein